MSHFFRSITASTLLAIAVMASSGCAAADTTPQVVDAKTLTTSSTGLQYKDLKTGTGAAAKVGTKVTVHYTGWLQNPDGSIGKKFDSSRDANQPFSFGLGNGNVIKGWDEGVQGMRVGGQRRLVIPAALGYGQRGAGGVIPPGATLIFDVELLSL
jgi:FKBP-type peptidyl-prolyl cis-trans isomerase FkpA